ncbi:RING finger protein 214 isoform X3 [Dendrobates tinctorius]|uniref:RING finger protein 214 isoform X3 n=1 Tax=Dendrobates tinctorius TaxID=92724 RepID=UPI003CC97F3C
MDDLEERRSAGDMLSAESALTPGDMSEGGQSVEGDHCRLQCGLRDSGGLLTQCIAVQTDNEKRDAETITDTETEKLLKLLVGRGEQLTETYQVVLDRQTQAEKQLQVKIKQQRQQAEEEAQRWKKYLKHIEDLVTKKQETRKKIEKERREHVQKEQDLGAELLKLQSKNDSLEKEHKEIENKITDLLAEQTAERKEWEAELINLKKKHSEANQSATEQIEHMRRAEVSSLESRRDLLLISLEEAEKEAEVTLSYLRVAPPNLEWITMKQRWEARLAGIQQMKANLQEQFEKQIKQVKNGTRLSSLPSILAPDLTPPPSDPSLMLHRIALAPAKMPPADVGPQGKAPQPYQHSHPMAYPTLPFPGNMASAPSVSDSPCLAGTDKLSKILEKLQARFPQHDNISAIADHSIQLHKEPLRSCPQLLEDIQGDHRCASYAKRLYSHMTSSLYPVTMPYTESVPNTAHQAAMMVPAHFARAIDSQIKIRSPLKYDCGAQLCA